ncbi:hypothetical protein MUG78_16855 [Gordonia alkaliphila]|uniref:hypothetical protein n=1 Tax=Gordonia alkaliphila TaxID=1053547 RepID=UPI001FF39191|nr:hypothetical protein [Gordonia alkaliphila]MCK0441071.1 hypothetical protein [Gordonia alkaliphila]
MSNDQKFDLGAVYLTRRVADTFGEEQEPIIELLQRHARGDWGSVGAEDAASNDQALIDGNQLLSAYTLPDFRGGETIKLWVITEADRATTTVLFPGEY